MSISTLTSNLLARGLVLCQFGLAAVIVLSTPWGDWPTTFASLMSLPLLLIGSGLAVWAWSTMGSRHLKIMPQPHQEAKLLRHGPYKWIRHPMYAGLLLATLGCCWWYVSLLRVACWLALLAVLVCKTQIEEALLAEKFAEYEQYRQATGRFAPKIW